MLTTIKKKFSQLKKKILATIKNLTTVKKTSKKSTTKNFHTYKKKIFAMKKKNCLRIV